MHDISARAVFWCSLFFVLGPFLILVNNHVFNKVHYQYPILFSSLGLWGTAIVCRVSALLGLVKIERKMPPAFWFTKVVPIGILSAATIGSGNTVYLYLSVSFTQMLKALTPVYILLCLVLFQVETPKTRVALAVLVISLGTAIASFGELRFSWKGFLLQSVADLFEGSRIVLLQIIMSSDFLSPIESMYFISPATALAQFVLVLMYERSALTDPNNWAKMSQYWYFFVLAFVLGTSINFVGMFVIKHTSGLMLKLLGVIRNNCLVLLSVIFLGESTTMVQMTGYMLSVIGFIWYTNLTHGGKTERVKIDKRDYTRVVDPEEMEEI
jgi:drug/metabolite transporter (DMT)-like permease